MTKDHNDNNIALFVDFENFVRSAMEIGLPVDLSHLVAKLLEYGRISVRRGFGDLDAACRNDWRLRDNMRRMIHENLVQFEDIPYVTKFKNTADMRLAVEALSLAYAHPDINYFAIVASDRDYVPLISKLKEHGRRIIGIGTSPDTVHDIYVRSCDVFIYYSSFFHPASSEEPVSDVTERDLLNSYTQLLLQAASATLAKGSKPVGGLLLPLMRQLRPDFDLKLVRMQSLRELAELAESQRLVTIGSSGGDILVHPGTMVPGISAIRAPVDRIDASDYAGAKAQYRQFLEDKMKCPLPSKAERMKIFDALARVIEAKKLVGDHLNLNSISTAIAEGLGKSSSGMEQRVIFKILYSLYRAKAFEAELTDEAYNPGIKGLRVTPEECDSFFIRNAVRVISRERRTWPLIEESLAELFESSPEAIRPEIDAVLE